MSKKVVERSIERLLMSRWKRVLLGSMAMGFVLLLVVMLLVKLYVTPEKIRDLLQTGLQSSLQREVSLGQIDVGLLRGIRLSSLNIADKSGTEQLLTTRNIEITYDLTALLRGNLLFTRILINEPHFRLVRQADGRLNISDLLGEESAVEQPQSATPAPYPLGSQSSDVARAIPLSIKHLVLQGGSLLFIDRKNNPQSPYRYRLDDLHIDVKDFSLDAAFPASLSAQLNDAPVSIDLLFGLNDGLKSLQLKSTQLNLVPFLPYFQEALPGSLGRGLLSTELLIEKQPLGYRIKGQAVVEELDIRLDLDNPLHWEKVRIALDQDLIYRLADNLLDINKLSMDIDGVQLDYRGKVQLAASAEVAGEANVKIADLREITDLLPRELQQQLAAYGIAGKITAQLQLSGAATGVDVIQQARIDACDIQASIGRLRTALNGTFTYTPGRLKGKEIDIGLKGQHLLIDLDARQIFSAVPELKMEIVSDRLDLDELSPQSIAKEPVVVSATGAEYTSAEGTQLKAPPAKVTSPPVVEGASAVISPLKAPVNGRFNLTLKQLLYHGLLLEQVKGLALLKDGRLQIDSLTANTVEGQVVLTAVAELEQSALPIQGTFKADNLNLSRLTDALLPEGQGSISGNLSTQGQFRSLAMAVDPLASLMSQGSFDLRDGEIKGSPLLKGLSNFLTNPELELVGFSRFQGRYELKKGQGKIDALLESRRVSFAPKGEFTLAGKLNMTLATRLAPSVMAKAGIGGKGAQLLTDDKGWTLLPLKIKGSYSQPRFSLDSKGVKKQLKKTVVRELGRQLQKQLGGKGDQPENQQLEELLRGTLNKLFGQ
ncbi:MAG: AsmA family protein [Geopsychrobacter sp.]|nr:AsmA family protein [Geopsychrobacter sp.]